MHVCENVNNTELNLVVLSVKVVAILIFSELELEITCFHICNATASKEMNER